MAQRKSNPKSTPPRFSPPPRPREVEEMTTGILMRPADDGANDPATGLFEALQSVKDTREQKALSKLTPPPPHEWGTQARGDKPVAVPSQVWLIATLTSVLWIAIWGLSKILDRTPAQSSPPVAAVPPAHVPPVQTSSRSVATPQAPRAIPKDITPLRKTRDNLDLRGARDQREEDRRKDERDERDERDRREEDERRAREELEALERLRERGQAADAPPQGAPAFGDGGPAIDPNAPPPPNVDPNAVDQPIH